MLTQRGLAPILIILLISAIIGGYLVYSGKISLPQKQVDQQTAETSEDEATEWKTYTNTRSEYSIKYPSNYAFSELNPEEPTLKTTDPVPTLSAVTFHLDTEDINKRISKMMVEVEQLDVELDENTDTGDYIRNVLFKDGFKGQELIALHKEQLGGVTAYRVLAKGGYGVPPVGNQPTKTAITFVRLNNNLYYIIFQTGGGPQIKPVYEYPNYSLYEQMITTLKPLDISTEKYIELNDGRKLLVKRVGEGEYCEGKIGRTQTFVPKCEEGLKCQFREGTSQDAPGTCVKE